MQPADRVIGRNAGHAVPAGALVPTAATSSSTMPSGSRSSITGAPSRSVTGRSLDVERSQPVVPERRRVLGDRERRRRGEAGADLAARHAVPGEERQQAGRPARLVAVVEVVGVRRVEVHRLLDQPQAEHRGVEVDVPLRVAGDRGDVVQAVGRDRAHGNLLPDAAGGRSCTRNYPGIRGKANAAAPLPSHRRQRRGRDGRRDTDRRFVRRDAEGPEMDRIAPVRAVARRRPRAVRIRPRDRGRRRRRGRLGGRVALISSAQRARRRRRGRGELGRTCVLRLDGVLPHVPETAALDATERASASAGADVARVASAAASATGLAKAVAVGSGLPVARRADDLRGQRDDSHLGRDAGRRQGHRPRSRAQPTSVVYDPELTAGPAAGGGGPPAG